VRAADGLGNDAVDDAEAKLAIAKANMERATTLLEFAQIKAPFAGTISARQVDPGAYSAAGGDTLLQVVDAETLRLQIPVVEVETALLRPGLMVDAKVDALGDSTVKATVSRIAGTLAIMVLATTTPMIAASMTPTSTAIIFRSPPLLVRMATTWLLRRPMPIRV